ncbi:glutathione S-transferase T3-like protein [Tanacetum coccineum]
MGGSSSQRHTEQPLSPIPSFRNEELYSPQFSEDMYQNTVREDSPVEVTPPPQPKPSRRRQKRTTTVRNEEVPRCTPWTNEEEIALCKGWVHVSENSAKGNARKTDGFWTEVKDYVHKKTNSDKRTYDMVCGKWKTVRPNVARFCGVHDNVARMAQESGAGDEDYFNKALLDYEAEFGLPFTLRHCWEVLKYSPKWLKQVVPKYSKSSKKSKTSGSSSFNTESGDASINLNVDAGDDDENEVQEIPRTMGRDKARGSKKKGVGSSGSSMNMNDETLARLMVSELATQTASAIAMKKDERAAYFEIKKREVELREREFELQAYRQRQEDMRFYMQPYDHLTGVQLAHMEAMRAEIKAKYNLPY